MGGSGGVVNRFDLRWTAGAAVALLALAARPAAAQNLEQYDYSNLHLRGVGAELIYVDPSQNQGTAGFGAKLDLGFLGPGLRVVPRFAYWKADVDADRVTELETQIAEVSDLPPGSVNLGQIQRAAYVLGADFEYIASVSRLQPYVGAGLDIYALNDDGAAIKGTFLDDLVITAGVSGVAGLQVQLAPNWDAYGEFRATAVTDASSLGVAFGLYYMFSR